VKGIIILLLIIFAAALPAIIIFFWFRKKKPEITLPWFLVSLAAGIISLLVAAFVQNIFQSFVKEIQNGFWPVFFGIFIRIALVEETSRFLTLYPVIKTGMRSGKIDGSFAASLGLAAGLGFALIESASYGMANINITLLRIFTAAPLHGACGIRAGTAIFIARKSPIKAAFYFITTVLIHGAYNLMIISPALPSVLAVLIALSAFFGSLHLLKDADEENETI